jgi:hypothetical protein
MYPARVSNPWQSVQNSRAGPANLKGDERGTLAFYGKNRLCVAADAVKAERWAALASVRAVFFAQKKAPDAK